MDAAADYRIRVQGKLTDSWRQCLDADWTVQLDGSAPESTTITGFLRDQADLMGLLSSLYDVGLPLLEVECLNMNAEQPGSGR